LLSVWRSSVNCFFSVFIWFIIALQWVLNVCDCVVRCAISQMFPCGNDDSLGVELGALRVVMSFAARLCRSRIRPAKNQNLRVQNRARGRLINEVSPLQHLDVF
jgi:hypothetical protein